MTEQRVSIDRIKAVVAERFDITVADLVGVHRDLKFVHPRHIAIHLACSLTPHSKSTIGRLFGGRDHSTIFSAHWKAVRRRAADREFDQRIRTIEAELRPREAPRAEIQLAFLIGPLFDRDPATPQPILRQLEAA